MDQKKKKPHNIRTCEKWPLLYSGDTKLSTELSAHSSLDLAQFLKLTLLLFKKNK